MASVLITGCNRGLGLEWVRQAAVTRMPGADRDTTMDELGRLLHLVSPSLAIGALLLLEVSKWLFYSAQPTSSGLFRR